MTDRRWRIADKAALGLAIVTLGCTTRGSGITLEDGGETAGDGETEGDGAPSTDTEPNDVPFELVSASLNATGQFVVLRFSEPVAPVGGVDPSDFRISYAQPTALCGSGGCVDQTTYWDANFYVDYYLGYQPYQPNTNDRFEVDQVSPGNQATDIFLRFGMPLNPALCEYASYYPDVDDFLFVHFSPGDIPVKSSDGESLAAIGPQWVEQLLPVWDVDGDFPNLDPKISIPCNL